MQYTYRDIFFHSSKQFLNSPIFMPFRASATFFVSPPPHWQNVSLWGNFFIWRNKKNVSGGEIGWIGRVGHRGHAILGQKLLKIQHGVGRCMHKSHIIKWQTHRRIFRKNSLKPNTASHNSASWYTDRDGLLEHSPNGGNMYCKGPALQKIILVFWGVPPRISFHADWYHVFYFCFFNVRNSTNACWRHFPPFKKFILNYS